MTGDEFVVFLEGPRVHKRNGRVEQARFEDLLNATDSGDTAWIAFDLVQVLEACSSLLELPAVRVELSDVVVPSPEFARHLAAIYQERCAGYVRGEVRR